MEHIHVGHTATDTSIRSDAGTAARTGAQREIGLIVATRMRTRGPELEEAIFARVRDGVPHPRGWAQEEYVQGLRAAVAGGVEYTLSGIERARSPTTAIPPAALAQARRAARAGVGLDTVLRRYLAGHTLLADYVMREAEHEDFAGQGAALRWLLCASSSLLDQLLAPVTLAYREEIARTRRPYPHVHTPTHTHTHTPRTLLPPILSNPNSHRARQCLCFLLAQQELHSHPSNREIAAGLGIAHPPQVSRLMSALLREGLVSCDRRGAGLPNAWRLTPRGQHVARSLQTEPAAAPRP